MRIHTVLCIVAAVVVALMLFAPEAEARIPRRKLQMLKKLGLAALLLKGKKKILFPLPLPLPLPLPVVHKTVAEPVPEPVAVPEPVYASYPSYPSYPAPEASYGQSYGQSYGASNYDGLESMGGGYESGAPY